ncbi:MAG: DJ-1/PfpI family protein [Erysipelotrichales bacterium]|nr:DJ-1/PfpI family protein [Erysipelotrichales bacterium]
MKFCSILSGGFEESEFTIVYDIFHRAGIQTDVYSLDAPDTVSSHGLHYGNFKPLAGLDPEEYDLLYIPGGKANVDHLKQSEKVSELVRLFAQEKKIAAICAAPSILGELGLLKNRKYTCYPGFQKHEYEGTRVDVYCVKDGNLYTGRSMAASLEFALMIVKDLLGDETAGNVKDTIVY